jgi:hypothetical protein
MGDPLEDSSSQASLHSTTPAAATTAAATAQKGKGGHISALRSLGLLHELQEYVSACVETQQQQEKELGKLKAEKKEVERVSSASSSYHNLELSTSCSQQQLPCIQSDHVLRVVHCYGQHGCVLTLGVMLFAMQVLKQKALRSADKQQPCLQQFQASEISDLPPRLRALFEDNKVCDSHWAAVGECTLLS